MRFPLRYKFFAIILASISVAFAIALYHYFQIVENSKQNAQLQNQAIAEQIAARFDSIIEQSYAALRPLAHHPSVIARDVRACDQLFGQLLPGFPHLLNIVAADMQGFNTGSALPGPKTRQLNYRDRRWFQAASAGSTVVGDLSISKRFNVPAIMIAMPVKDGDRQVGVVGMSLDLVKVRKGIHKTQQLPRPPRAMSLMPRVMSLSASARIEGNQEHGETCSTVKLIADPGSGRIQGVGSDGIERMYSVAPIPNTEWVAVVGMPTAVAYQNAALAARRYLLVITGAAVMAALLALLLSANISRRARTVTAAMREMEHGNYSVQVPVQGGDELAVVADSFNRMAHQCKTAEEELRRSSSFVSTVLEGIGEGVIMVDRNFRILSANSGYCRQLKLTREEVIGRTCHKLSHHSDTPCRPEAEGGCACAVRKCFETGEEQRAIHRHLDQNGAPLYVETRAYPLMDAAGAVTSAVETLADITDRRQLESQLFHAKKMEAIGLLAGGVAHDFNNLLTAIVGYANLLHMQLPAGEDKRQHVDQILAAAERAAGITRGLLAFSRKQAMEPAPLRLSEVVRGVEAILRRIIGTDVDLRVDLAPNEFPVLADATQLDQVILNLCTNARDAMPGGGTVTIATEVVVLDRSSGKHQGTLQEGTYMLLSVADTGAGMDDATKEKIFEPFFTTKQIGKGTGLGLSIIYGIVKQHGGAIDVASEPGRGTTFHVYLPVSAGTANMVKAPDLPIVGGSEVILVAEDDSTLLTLAVNILRSYGYQVIPAHDGVDAVEKFRGHPDTVDLVILDVLMPRMNGREAFEEIRKHHEDIRTLFMSGYSTDVLDRKDTLSEDFRFIPKPFSPSELLRKVRETLSVPPQPAPLSD